jgi:uncharacterized protein
MADIPDDTQAIQLQRARDSLTEVLANYAQYADLNAIEPEDWRSPLKVELDRLSKTLDKLDRYIIRIAVFGLVSRGKSAVLNALMGESVLEVGPINGVTREIQVRQWTPGGMQDSIQEAIQEAIQASIQFELIDTPGLDEVDGETRSAMAQSVAGDADLILFITSGPMMAVEYAALCELRQAQKPLILVFNKLDRYPETTRASIQADLQRLSQCEDDPVAVWVTPAEIALVAADPLSMQVRNQYADGRIETVWEKPPIQIDDLTIKLQALLQREGRSLLALNVLTQSRSAQLRMVDLIIQHRQVEATALIAQFARYKAIGVGLNPFGFLDFVGGAIADLAMIRALANLYSLPMTRFAAADLLKTILISSGSLLVSELFGGIVLGFGKGFLSLSESFGGYTIVGLVQSGIAAYGSYAVGRSAQLYLEQGCTWGEKGADTVICEILAQVDRDTIIHRIQDN